MLQSKPSVRRSGHGAAPVLQAGAAPGGVRAIAAESVRVLTTREGGYRVRAPNSRPRDILVVALDSEASRILVTAAAEGWRGARFRSAVPLFETPGARTGGRVAWRDLLQERGADMLSEIAGADLVLMVAAERACGDAVARIGEACKGSRVKTAGVILHEPGSPWSSWSSILRELRRSAETVSVCSAPDLLPDMLRGLGA